MYREAEQEVHVIQIKITSFVQTTNGRLPSRNDLETEENHKKESFVVSSFDMRVSGGI